MKLPHLFFLAALAWGQESAKPGINADTTSLPKAGVPTVAELQAENTALRATIVQLKQYYGNSLTLLQVQHDAVVKACVGNPPAEPPK